MVRPLISKVPSALLGLGQAVKKANHLLTFAIAPFTEVQTSIKMVEKRMGDPAEWTNKDVALASVGAALDAASFGIVRNVAKTPIELISPLLGSQTTDKVTNWIDEHVNAGAVSDAVVIGAYNVFNWAMDEDIPQESAQIRR